MSITVPPGRGRRAVTSTHKPFRPTRTRTARGGAVVELSENSPPILFHHGEGFRLERLPAGTRVVYPPPPLAGVPDVDGVIQRALDHPLGSDPLSARLAAGMRLTIAFDDISLPLPPMRLPDIRQRVIERVVETAVAAGVEDIHLICAQALHRKLTGPELRRILGDRLFDAFWPHSLYNYDAEDPEGNVVLGHTPHGEAVEISRRAAESDLLVYVNINLVAMDGGHKSVAVGLGTYNTMRAHHNVRTLLESRSYMDPENSALHHSAKRQGRIVEDAIPIFHIETTLNNDMYAGPMRFLGRPEWEWTARDRATFLGVQRALRAMPDGARRAVFQRQTAPYAVTGVTAGEVDAVHRRTLEAVHAQQSVPVSGQADILTMGVPYIGPYNVNSVLNPVLVMCLSLGYFFNLYQGRPLVREGGVLIMTHPVPRQFHPVHHPSYIPFYDEVLAESRDPAVIEERWEEHYAQDEWFRHLYRTSHAYHGVHPFYMWYWGAHALAHLGEVIVVGGDPATARHLGFRPAQTMADALEMAASTVGRSPSITHFHCPPVFYATVS
jgi:hypothetical protein